MDRLLEIGVKMVIVYYAIGFLVLIVAGGIFLRSWLAMRREDREYWAKRRESAAKLRESAAKLREKGLL